MTTLLEPGVHAILKHRKVHSAHDMAVYGHADLVSLLVHEAQSLRNSEPLTRARLFLAIGGAAINNLHEPQWIDGFRSASAEQRSGGMLGWFLNIPVWSDVYETRGQRVLPDWTVEFCSLGAMPN